MLGMLSEWLGVERADALAFVTTVISGVATAVAAWAAWIAARISSNTLAEMKAARLHGARAYLEVIPLTDCYLNWPKDDRPGFFSGPPEASQLRVRPSFSVKNICEAPALDVKVRADLSYPVIEKDNLLLLQRFFNKNDVYSGSIDSCGLHLKGDHKTGDIIFPQNSSSGTSGLSASLTEGEALTVEIPESWIYCSILLQILRQLNLKMPAQGRESEIKFVVTTSFRSTAGEYIIQNFDFVIATDYAYVFSSKALYYDMLEVTDWNSATFRISNSVREIRN